VYFEASPQEENPWGPSDPSPPQRDKSGLATINPRWTKVRAVLFRAHIHMFPVVPATLKSRLLKGEVVKAQIDSQFQFRQRDQMMHLILGPPLDSLPTGFTQEYKFDFWHMGRVLGRCL